MAAVRYLSDCMRIMRLAIARRNPNDPDSSDATLLQYIQDFIALTMSDDLKIFEQFSTLVFTIDETNPTGVYDIRDVGGGGFVNLSQEAFVSLLNPPANSVSWNQLWIYQDPGVFFSIWGVNNEEILIPGYPTMMLYYGNDLTFRTIPNTSYQITIYGYQEVPEFDPAADPDGDPPLPKAYWMRYIAYGAALNYARDYKFETSNRSQIEHDFMHERKLLLIRTHNQIKQNRAYPRF